jgi:tyrosine-protein phosphatase YwqE
MFTFLNQNQYSRSNSEGHIDIHSFVTRYRWRSKTFEDTLRLTRALQNWVSEFITTPHIIQHVFGTHARTNFENQSITVSALEKILLRYRHAAAEYLMDDQFVQLFQSRSLLTLKDNYVLVEMSYINPPSCTPYFWSAGSRLHSRSSPERYLFYHNNFNEYHKLKRAGCLFQLNLLAVVGYYGAGIAKVAEELLKDMYTYVGSDVHHDKHIEAFSQNKSETPHFKKLLPIINFSKGNYLINKKTQRLYFGLFYIKQVLLV